ncbi:NUDIX domain-containing protein [Candidatus Gracilibacteria bacterium]|nr:NUDIX domain-containing protein [Candidatus Gracilibacteria bacterium]
MSQSELLACFDSDGNGIEPHVRAEVHAQPLQYWHATNGIWVVNREGQILISQRAPTCERNAGKWQSSFGGHVLAGLNWRSSAVVELEEEAGLKATANELFLISKSKNDADHHFVERFMYLYDPCQTPHSVDGEVSAFRWIAMADCLQEQITYPDQYCNLLYPENVDVMQKRLAEILTPKQ